MFELSEQDRKELGYLLVAASSQGVKHAADEAVAFIAPLVLKEALKEITPQEWSHAMHQDKNDETVRQIIVDFCGNRLARLTALPDPAVEAVRNLHIVGDGDDETLRKIVATVDQARGRESK